MISDLLGERVNDVPFWVIGPHWGCFVPGFIESVGPCLGVSMEVSAIGNEMEFSFLVRFLSL